MTNRHIYRYSLGKRRGVCPDCGRRTFKLYIDNTTGAIVDPACGRCNREVKCGCHRPPRRFTLRRSPSMLPCVARPLQTSYIDPDLARQPAAWLYGNNLFRHLSRFFAPDELLRAFEACGVTHARFCGNATAFWLRDMRGRIRSAKVMAYGTDGHRLKLPRRQTVAFAHSLLRLEGFHYTACYFGEHLAARFPDAVLVLVESEKTALMLNTVFLRLHTPKYVALATGGCSALSVDPLRMGLPGYRGNILRYRDLVLLPDADMVDRWRREIPALSRYAHSVRLVDVCRPPYALTGSADIADWLEAHPGHR